MPIARERPGAVAVAVVVTPGPPRRGRRREAVTPAGSSTNEAKRSTRPREDLDPRDGYRVARSRMRVTRDHTKTADRNRPARTPPEVREVRPSQCPSNVPVLAERGPERAPLTLTPRVVSISQKGYSAKFTPPEVCGGASGRIEKVNVTPRAPQPMRFSIVVPDEVIATVRERAKEAGISQTEWARRLVLAGCDGRAPPGTPPDASEVRRLEDEIADAGARIVSLTAAIAAAEAEADRTRDETTAARLELETATAERDRAREDLAAERVRVAVLEAEAKKDAEHIRSLQSAIATVAAGARPALDTIADQDQGRPGILASARARVRAFMAR